MASSYDYFLSQANPIINWRFDGNMFYDELQNASFGAINVDFGQPGIYLGSPGSMYFDGVSGEVTGVLNQTPLYDTNFPLSFEFWITPEDKGSSEHFLLSEGSSSGSAFNIRILEGGIIRVWTGVANLFTDTPISFGEAHHIVIAIASSNITLYVDGVFQDLITVNTGNASNSSATNFTIGCSSTSSKFKGYMDKLAIFDRILSEPEIIQRYKFGTLSATHTISGKCVRGVANLPAYRQVHAYALDGSRYLGYSDTDSNGNFTIQTNYSGSTFLRIVDPNGIYSTEIRENIIPTPNPEE